MRAADLTDPAPATGAGSRLRLLVITGSVRTGRFGPVVAGWFSRHAAGRPSTEVVPLDVAHLEARTADLAAALRGADAVVVVTPEYNHSFPGPLKSAIDSVHDEWRVMPVGFVSYGGISGGLRAVEALRVVFAELGAVTARETVSFATAWDAFEDDSPRDATAAEAAADRLLDQLAWWAAAVRLGRQSGRQGA